MSGVLADTEEAIDGVQDTGRSIEDEGRSIEVAVEGRGPRPMYTTGSGTTNSPVRGSSASCVAGGTPGYDDAVLVFCALEAPHRDAVRCARSSRETRGSAPVSCTASGARRRRSRRAGLAGASYERAGSAGGACVARRTRLCARADEASSGASSLAGGSMRATRSATAGCSGLDMLTVEYEDEARRQVGGNDGGQRRHR